MEYHFLVPTSMVNGKYPMVKDSSGRNITSAPLETNGNAAIKMVSVNQRYIKTVAQKWNIDLEKYVSLDTCATAPIAVSGDKYLFDIKDFESTKIIGFCHNLINTPDTTNLLKKYNLNIAILPHFDPEFDYMRLPAIEGLIWISPYMLRIASIIKPLMVDNTRVFDTFDETWTKYVIQPKNKFYYPKAQKDSDIYVPAVLENRPDVLLLPIPLSLRYDSNTIDIVKSVHYQLSFYISLATNHDIFKEEINSIINKQWIDMVGKVINSGEASQMEYELERTNNELASEIRDMERTILDMVNIRSRQKAANEFGKKSVSLSAEVQMLREWGCSIENNYLVYPVKKIIIKHSGKYHLIGDLDILVDLSNPSRNPTVRVSPNYPKKLNRGGYPHPHVTPDGNVCFGDISREIPVAMKSHSYAKALMLIGELLRNYNHSSPYNKIHNWPECDKEGNLVYLATQQAAMAAAQQPTEASDAELAAMAAAQQPTEASDAELAAMEEGNDD